MRLYFFTHQCSSFGGFRNLQSFDFKATLILNTRPSSVSDNLETQMKSQTKRNKNKRSNTNYKMNNTEILEANVRSLERRFLEVDNFTLFLVCFCFFTAFMTSASLLE